MSKLATFFLFFVTALAVLVSANGFLVQTDMYSQIFQILFVPITVYLFVSLASHITLRSPVFGVQTRLGKILILYCLIVSCVFVTAGFLSSESQVDFISTLVYAPLAIYFFVTILPQRNMATISPAGPRSYPQSAPNPKLDESRRDFLKLIGTAGISIFVYNLLFRRDAGSLFGSFSPTNPLALKNAQGEVINPAEKSPTQGYYISQVDDGTATSYYGFINSLGQWFIMRQDVNNAYRYSRGDRDFESNWNERTKLDYDFFDNVF